MIIISARVDSLHGYISSSINFNEDLTIITGPNGSGKTSLLSLIDALLSLDTSHLENTKFNELEVNISHQNEKYKIIASNNDEEFTLKVNNEKISYIKQDESDDNDLFIDSAHLKNSLKYKLNKKRRDESSSFQILYKVRVPLLLGINRKLTVQDESLSNNLQISRLKRNEKISFSKKISNPIILSVQGCKDIIKAESKRIRMYEQAQGQELQEKLISSSFDFIKSDSILGVSLDDKLEVVFDKKDAIILGLKNLGFKNNDRTIYKINQLFEELAAIRNNLKSAQKNDAVSNVQFEFILNYSQVVRVSQIVSIIEEHNNTMDIKKERINLFIKVVNSFFNLTNREIKINSDGDIHVLVDNKHKVEVNKLSSGEMQLIIIIANMVFSKPKTRPILFIDEPEISLHIRWQEMFIDTLQSIDSGFQLILATHSPDIIVSHKIKCEPITSEKQKVSQP